MKIVFQNRVGETVTKEWRVGLSCTGLRLTQMIFESPKELHDLTTDKGQAWLKASCHRIFPYMPSTLGLQESNWGSDWVDDGV